MPFSPEELLARAIVITRRTTGMLGVELEHGPRDPETDVSGNDPIVTGELGPFGIAVVLIEPGNIGTRFNETALSGSTFLLNRGDSPYAALYARFKAQTTRGYRDAIQHRRHVAGQELGWRRVVARC